MAREANCVENQFGLTECPQTLRHGEVNHEHSGSNNEAPIPSIDHIEAAASVEHLENLLHSTNDAIIAEIDQPMSSHSMSLGTDEWMTAVVLAEKQIFFSKKQLYSKIRVLALQEKFQFRVTRSSMKMLTVVCVDDNCKWMLRASTVKQSAIFMICKFINVHTYSLDFCHNAHRHATSSVIVEHILGKLDTPGRSYDLTAIARDMERELGVKISYNKACRGKFHALTMLHSIPEASFQKLSSYYHVVGESNPRTVTHKELDSQNRFYYFCLAFGASIRGYTQYLRPVIYVDGSHLKGPYKGTLLLAIAQYGNKQIYPLAWGIVDAETNKSWKWFMSNLKELIRDSEDLVFVSDRKKSIDKTITQLFLLSHHGCCIWHLEKNLIQRYSNASAILLFKRAATTYRVEDFEKLMGQIRRTSKYWRGAYSETIYPVGLEADWVVPSLITFTPILPPLVRCPSGRPPTRRKHSRHESIWSSRKCTHCGRLGHNRSTCSNPNVSQVL
ncbi:uncharacterized protein LOC111411141 [Olea europaea var. sylvestris]|uniref:uncharacterized protein LOC111411141 n=1 Tax=Olea europaea var. sylvestris TaxID=158386 RepID=UPI000C1D08FE|nr:uncharacterized protein LOC111411141 [Olea europaea var. sylvestris]